MPSRAITTRYRDLQKALDRGTAMIALVIPGDFAAKVQAGKPVKIQIIGDGSDANTSRLAMGYAATIGTIYSLQRYGPKQCSSKDEAS